MKSILKDLAALGGIVFFLFIGIGTFLVYWNTGVFGFHWNVLKNIFGQNVHYLLFTIGAMTVAIFGIVNYFLWLLSQRRNCQIQYVELSQIAMHWLEQSDVETNIRDKIEAETVDVDISSKGDSTSISTELSMKLLDLTGDTLRNFVKKAILPFSEKFNEYEIKIIFDLLNLLDKEGEISSVASLYANDPEIKIYGDKAITMSGKTSYDILSEYTLVDHTIRVANNIVILLEHGGDQMGKGLLYSRAIIVALAHDIGKIEVKNSDIRIAGEMYRKTPHEHISALLFSEMYPDYIHVKSINDAIRVHHLPKINGELAVMLREADKKAREIEIRDWLIKNKETISGQNVEDASQSVSKELSADKANTDNQKNVETKSVKKLNQSPLSSKQKTPHIKEKVFEYDFMEAHSETLIRVLYENVNALDVSKATGETKIISISFGNVVLFDYMFFKKNLEIITKKRLDKESLIAIFKQLKDQGLIKIINVSEGFLVSRFIVEDSQSKTEMNFVPIDCEMIGLTEQELEESKRAHYMLRTLSVCTYEKNNEV